MRCRELSPVVIRLRRLIGAGCAALCLGGTLRAQTAITSITTQFTAGTNTTVTIDGAQVTSNNDVLALKSVTDADGNSYTVSATTAQAAYYRTAGGQGTNTDTDPSRVSAWYMGNAGDGSSAPSSILGGYNSGSPSSLLLNNNLLEGADNLFNNVNSSSSDNNNAGDVERLDVIYSTTGRTATDTLAIGVFDRGTGDTFKIALITGIDSNGRPTSYAGALITVTSQNFGGELLNSANSNSTVRNDGGEPTEYLMRYTSTTSLAGSNVDNDTQELNQNLSGVILTMSDFGIATGTKIYGYSLMGGDVSDGGNINNLVNYNNSTYFPTNTADTGSGSSGLDVAAVQGAIFEEHPIPEPSLAGAALVGLGLAGAAFRRLRPSRA